MNVGATVRVTVNSRDLWNRTGIVLTAGGTYRFEAHGKWVDWFIGHGPDGDPSDWFYMRWFESRRRVPHANWFALIGTIGGDMSTAFVIGSGGEHLIRNTGELTCFANDVEGFYWNNRGEVSLSVTRIN